MLRQLLVAIVVLGSIPSAGGAQTALPIFTLLKQDSTAWQRVLDHVVSSLGSQLVKSSVDPSLQPWRITLPDDEPQRALLESQLRTILRARPPVDTDSVTYEITLGPLSIVSDTARVKFISGVTQHCPGRTQTGGFVNVTEILVPRTREGFWGVARSGVVMHGDRFGCPSPTPRRSSSPG